ncbi:MAG TPA: RecX family transcriptional regulator [Sphingomicrobium sp.]|nr:RecX family transcriptional regulator [Sphingomicrobium sp.]
MARPGPPKRRPPLDRQRLEELALRYVGKYATTRAKLRAYLGRKLRERGWEGAREPDLEALASRFAELGYIDDASYALGQSRSLSARGYGKRRLTDKLRLAGIEESDRGEANRYADKEAVSAALRFAERRRLGPFAAAAVDRAQREKWIATMVRAGHGFAIARVIASLPPGAEIDDDQLSELVQVIDV